MRTDSAGLNKLNYHHSASHMGDQQFECRSTESSVQDVVESGQRAQLALHGRAPGPHSVDIVGEPLRTFSTFVTLTHTDASNRYKHSL
jgi:hypothetical protein